VRDERALFELLCLEGFQAGLSWITILRKRVAFREAFAGFDIRAVAGFGTAEVDELLTNPAIVRHRGKITAAIANARAVEAMAEQGTSLSEIVWTHAPLPREAPPADRHAIPDRTPESVALAKELRRWGMRFVGPTTVYAFMQSAGLVDDHLADCFRSGVGNVARRNAHRHPKPLPKPQRRRRSA
jgi:DNA-3-methyladenine glycosylase I